MKIFFDDEDLDAQFQRTLTHAYERAADLGEAFETAARIVPGDDDSWYQCWTDAAKSACAAGEASRENGGSQSSCEAFLRAFEYYRQAMFFLRSDLADPRLLATYKSMRRCFRDALPGLPFGVVAVRIPYEETAINGYLMFPSDSEPPWPTVLLPSGYDNNAEDGYLYAAPALRRGYAVLSFEGPGQGGVLYEQGLFFRPDFEAVLTPVVDFLLEYPDLDAERLVLIGRSFASYLAARGASVEHRLAALICDPGQPDLGARIRSGVPAPVLDMIRTDDTRADKLLAPMLETSSGRRFWLPRMAAHGTETLHEYLRQLLSYSMDDRVADIRCPTLVTEAEGDFAGGQSRRFFETLRCDKEFRGFTQAEGAGGHIAGLGQQVWNGYVFDWLDQTLRSSQRGA